MLYQHRIITIHPNVPKNVLENIYRSILWLYDIVQKQPPEVFYEKSDLRNFSKLTGKHPCQSLFFNKIAGLSLATLFKKRLWYRCFPVNFVNFLGTPSLQNTSGRLLLIFSWFLTILPKMFFSDFYRFFHEFFHDHTTDLPQAFWWIKQEHRPNIWKRTIKTVAQKLDSNDKIKALMIK